MGLLGDYIDFVRGSYESYGEAIETQDLGVGADYEAITGEPFGIHVVATGVIGLASGKIWVGTVSHLMYHALEKVYSGIADSISVDDVVSQGDNTLTEVNDWLGEPAIPGLPGYSRGDAVFDAASIAGRRFIARQRKIKGDCPSKNWRGKKCSLYRGHSKFLASGLSDHNYV